MKLAIAAAEDHLALQDIEGLVLVVVDVQRRPRLRGDDDLAEREAAAGVLGGGLDGDPVRREPEMLAVLRAADDEPVGLGVDDRPPWCTGV